MRHQPWLAVSVYSESSVSAAISAVPNKLGYQAFNSKELYFGKGLCVFQQVGQNS